MLVLLVALGVTALLVPVVISVLLFATAQGVYLLGATVLLVMRAQRWLLCALVPGVVASGGYLLAGRPGPVAGLVWLPLAVCALLAVVFAVLRTARPGPTIGGALVGTELRAALPHALFGLLAAGLLVFPVVLTSFCSGSVVPVAALLSVPLSLSMGAAEWSLYSYRRRVRKLLQSSHTVGQFVASDTAALVRYTQRVVYLDDGELATVRSSEYHTSTGDARHTDKAPVTVDLADDDYQLGTFNDFMAKEIHEQPTVVRRALLGRLDDRFSTAHLGGLGLDARSLRSIRRVKLLGCGSAYYAGQIGANLIEELARVPADAEPASEFRYRNPVIDADTLYIAISQSGETLDTLAAVQELNRKGAQVLGVVNVVGSAIARECGRGVFLHAGPEVSVASTKAFTNMAVSLAMLSLLLGRVRDLSPAHGRRIITALHALPDHIAEILDDEEEIAALAHRYAHTQHMFFIGRGRCWPVAREGAQKLKEISYVHAEAYQSAELKHGPLALIDHTMPSVVIVPDDELAAKNIATIEQIKARGGPVISVTNANIPNNLADAIIRIPHNEPELDPILLTIPLQLFAYHLATKLGRDIDNPRNLAKSVTVE